MIYEIFQSTTHTTYGKIAHITHKKHHTRHHSLHQSFKKQIDLACTKCGLLFRGHSHDKKCDIKLKVLQCLSSLFTKKKVKLAMLQKKIANFLDELRMPTTRSQVPACMIYAYITLVLA